MTRLSSSFNGWSQKLPIIYNCDIECDDDNNDGNVVAVDYDDVYYSDDDDDDEDRQYLDTLDKLPVFVRLYLTTTLKHHTPYKITIIILW
jgi:hypothetical protein